MRSRLVIALCSALALVACQKKPEPKVEAPAPAGASVALPQKDLPPSDASIPPSAPSAANSGNAASPTQGTPAPLSKEREQTAMPETGQPNSHSTPNTTGEQRK